MSLSKILEALIEGEIKNEEQKMFLRKRKTENQVNATFFESTCKILKDMSVIIEQNEEKLKEVLYHIGKDIGEIYSRLEKLEKQMQKPKTSAKKPKSTAKHKK